jgi:hypothetical protein
MEIFGHGMAPFVAIKQRFIGGMAGILPKIGWHRRGRKR